MVHLPTVAPRRHSSYLQPHIKQREPPSTEIVIKTSPLVEVIETQWLVVSNAKRGSWLLLVTGDWSLDTAFY